jgi:hypothetical protein
MNRLYLFGIMCIETGKWNRKIRFVRVDKNPRYSDYYVVVYNKG